MEGGETGEYQAVFFAECTDLLDELQDRFDQMLEGDVGPGVIDAAFRAVHSIKGGASAFGLDGLVGFAHVFETTLDLLRSGTLDLGPELLGLLHRAGDIIALLVEQARDGTDISGERIDRVLRELHAAGGVGEEPPECAHRTDGSRVDDAGPAKMHRAAQRDMTVRLRPLAQFHRRGHDLLKLIRGLKEYGAGRVTPPLKLPPPAEFDLHAAGQVWTLQLRTCAATSAIEGYFDVYDKLVDVEIERVAPDGPEDADARAEATGSDRRAEERAAHLPVASKSVVPPLPAARSREENQAVISLRVETRRIDQMVDLLGEIAITQAVLARKLSKLGIAGDLELGGEVETMARQTRELRNSVMSIRKQPVRAVFRRMPRLVRDLSDTLGKDVRIQLCGEQTRLDTMAIEELAEPLTHMLRNSMDHGIEPDPDTRVVVGKPPYGTIRLSAELRGERVIITVADDGRGIDRRRVRASAIDRGLIAADESLDPEEIDQLIFHPGLSTVSEISSVSGRGVGLDVVRKKIQSLGGRCSLRNRPGEGLAFTLTLPLTLDVMAIGVGDEWFILPLSSVGEVVMVEPGQVKQLPRGQALSLRGEDLPLISLRRAMALPAGVEGEEWAILVDAEAEGLLALLFDELIGQRQVVPNSLGGGRHRVDGLSGATILGDGRIAHILDVPALARLVNRGSMPINTRSDTVGRPPGDGAGIGAV